MQRLLSLHKFTVNFRYCQINDVKKKLFLVARVKPSERNFMSRTSEKLENQLKSKDLVPDGFKIIYRGNLDNYIYLSYLGSTIFIILGLTSLYNHINFDKPLQFPLEPPIQQIRGIQNYTQLFIMYASYFAMTYAGRCISLRYVWRIYYNSKTRTYIAVTLGRFSNIMRQHSFQAGTLKRVTKKHMIPWWNTQYLCNGQKLIIFDEGFKTSYDYDRMFDDFKDVTYSS